MQQLELLPTLWSDQDKTYQEMIDDLQAWLYTPKAPIPSDNVANVANVAT